MKRNIFVFLILIIIVALSTVLFSCATAEKYDSEPSDVLADDGRTESGDSAAGDHRDGPAEVSSEEPGATPSPAAEPVTSAEKRKAEGAGKDDAVAEASETAPGYPGDDSFFGVRAADESESVMPMMFEEDDVSGLAAGGGEATAGREAPSQSGLKAGYSDDNRQYGYFLRFLEEYGEGITPLKLDISERLIFSVTGSNGKPIHRAEISLSGIGGGTRGLTHADGTWQFNPSSRSSGEFFTATVTPGPDYPGISRTVEIDRNGPRTIEIQFDTERVIPDPIPMDIVFVMDTTGSMGEEIERLKNTIQIIHLNLTSLSIPADVRFGMVLYKDLDDEYRTKTIPLTSNLSNFQAELDKVSAYGGGDTPEDLEAALDELINSMEWNSHAIQLAYIITDAPPHLDYRSEYTCADAARDARAQGLKIYGIGTGGLDLQGEYILRQIAQYTAARYIFLTYGSETGESAGGAAGSVSHHTGSNWNADKLESIIIRFAREEISYLTDRPLVDEDPWFEAARIDAEEVEDTLASLFDQAMEQLLDYSTFPVTVLTPMAVLPFRFEGDHGATAEYFNEHFILSAGRSDRLSLAERKEISQVLAELEFQNTGLTDEGSVGKIGELLNAEVLVSGNLFLKSGKFELFLKLLRTETGEVLSITRAVIDPGLGL